MPLTLQHYPGLVLAARPGVVPARLSLSRPSVATRVTALGLVEEVAGDTLRDDYDLATGAYLGWCIEEPRTNLARHARDLTQAVWSKTNAAVTKDAIGADGTTGGACRVAASAAGAVVTQLVTAATAWHCFALDLKPLTVTGAVSVTVDGGATWTDVTAKLVAGRFTRVAVAKSVSNPVVGLRLSAAGDSVAADYAQCEAGAYPTSRIVTAASTVTRQGDVLTVPDLAPFWNRAEGTLVMDARAYGSDLPTSSPRQTLLSVGDTSAGTSAVIELQRQPDYASRLGWGFGTQVGYAAAATSNGLWSAEGYRRTAVGWTAGQGDPTVAVDGATWRPALAGGGLVNPLDAAGRTLAIGHQRRGGVQRHLSGHVRLVLHYPRRLPDATLQDLTA